MCFYYNVYGLGVRSALPLPELIAATEMEADVVIRRGRVGPPLPEIARTGSYFHTTTEEAYFFWDRVGTFLVRKGEEIIVDSCPGVDECVVRLPLLGIVLAGLLYQRGVLVLHSSAVSVDDVAIAFLGNKESGKSTMAAVLYARGHQLVADDVVAVGGEEAGGPLTLPAFPQLKLWPAAVVASLGEDPAALPRLHSRIEKRARQITYGFAHRPVPLGRIYVLDRGPSPEIEPLRPQEAMVQLIANSYASRFSRPLPAARRVLHFLQCAELARDVPAFRLKRPPSHALLPTIARLVEEHLANGTSKRLPAS